MDHTDILKNPGIPEPVPGAYNKSLLLTGAEGSRAGAVIAISVAKGDKVSATAFAKYFDPEGSEVTKVPFLATTLINAFTGTTGMTNEFVNQSITGSFTGDNGTLIGTTGFGVPDEDAPRAFLNLLFLPEDETVTIGTDQFRFDQIGEAFDQPLGQSKTLFDELTIDEYEVPSNDYVLVYVSNEGSTEKEVYFDDINVTLIQNQVVQKDDFYPFGLSFNQFRRVGDMPNKYLYQGNEQLDSLEWYDFHARGYHPALGRFMQVDPQGSLFHDLSPYNAMLNNPVIYSDSDGECPICVVIVIGAIVGGGINVATNWNNIDNVWEGLGSFAAGAVVGAATAACGSCGGAVAIAVAGGAVISATNNVIQQTGNGTGLNDVKWGQVELSAGVGGLSGLAGYGAGRFASNNLASPLINSWKVSSPVVSGLINGSISSGAGGYAGGFVSGYILTGDLAAANQYGLSGLKTGFSLGGGVGAGSSYLSATRQGINPWTGKPTTSKIQADNINHLRKFAGSKGWERRLDSNIEEYGVYGDDGYSWRLKIKLEASPRPGIQSGSLYPRASVRTDLGNFFNPFTNQNVPASIGGHIPLQQTYPTVQPAPVQINWWWR